MSRPSADLQFEAQLQAEMKAAEPIVAEVRQLYADMQRELERRYNVEVTLLRATPEFRAMLRELVDYAAARPAGRIAKTDELAAQEAA